MEKNYDQMFRQLGINVKPLEENYSPETFGRKLMEGVYNRGEVVYSASTNYVNKKETTKEKCQADVWNRV